MAGPVIWLAGPLAALPQGEPRGGRGQEPAARRTWRQRIGDWQCHRCCSGALTMEGCGVYPDCIHLVVRLPDIGVLWMHQPRYDVAGIANGYSKKLPGLRRIMLAYREPPQGASHKTGRMKRTFAISARAIVMKL